MKLQIGMATYVNKLKELESIKVLKNYLPWWIDAKTNRKQNKNKQKQAEPKAKILMEMVRIVFQISG
jgi:hypothetical protein